MGKSIQISLLGPALVERGGAPVHGFESRKALALLAYLVVAGQPVPRARLVDLFWGDKTEARGRGNLSRVLHNLSKLLPGHFYANRQTVQFLRAPAGDAPWVDLDVFAALEANDDATSLAAAADLYRGEFLDGLYLDGCPEFEIWLLGEQERCRQRAAQVLDRLVAHHGSRGEVQQGLRYARRLLALEPWREETHRHVMQLLARSGQRSAALAQYATCRRVLAEELGVEPMDETVALYDRIRAVDRFSPLP